MKKPTIAVTGQKKGRLADGYNWFKCKHCVYFIEKHYSKVKKAANIKRTGPPHETVDLTRFGTT